MLDQARASGREPRLHFYAGLVHERVRAWQRAAEAFAAVPPGLGDVSLEARLHRGQCLYGRLEQHEDALDRLLREESIRSTDFFRPRHELVDEAYAKRGNEIAYVEKSPTAGGAPARHAP